MGHAGAIISGNSGSPEHKVEKLKEGGGIVSDSPGEIGITLSNLLKNL